MLAPRGPSPWPFPSSYRKKEISKYKINDKYPWPPRRSHWGVGPRQKLMPLFEALSNSSRDEAALGARLNVGDTGFSPHHFKRDNYVFLDAQCNNRYQIHTAGFSYSAGAEFSGVALELVLGGCLRIAGITWVQRLGPGLGGLRAGVELTGVGGSLGGSGRQGEVGGGAVPGIPLLAPASLVPS